MDEDCSIVIAHIAPDGSICEICGKPAPWQMYCEDCGHILNFYCDEHAYISQGTEKLHKHIKKAYKKNVPPKMVDEINEAKAEWEEYLEKDEKESELPMRCSMCGNEMSKYKLKTIGFKDANTGEKIEAMFCTVCYDKAQKEIENGDPDKEIQKLIREANGDFGFNCEICGKEIVGEPIYIELGDREDPINGGAALSICENCHEKIWELIDQLSTK